jgi:hypothetical protein
MHIIGIPLLQILTKEVVDPKQFNPQFRTFGGLKQPGYGIAFP